MRHRQPPASRTFASGTRSEDRSDRPGLPWSGYRAPVARSSVAGRRSPRKPAASRDREPTRRADALPNLVVSASSSPRLPIPLLEPRARKRARTHARSTGLGRGHRAGGVTPVEQDAGPAVKTSGPRLPPRDAKRAVGGIRAWGENPGRRASSLATLLPFWTFACADLKSCLRGPLRGHRRTPRQPRRARTPTASPPRDHRTRPRSEQSAMPIGIPVQRNARATMPRGLEKPARRPRAASATGRMRPRRDRARAADPWALRAGHPQCDRRATRPTAATAALAANGTSPPHRRHHAYFAGQSQNSWSWLSLLRPIRQCGSSRPPLPPKRQRPRLHTGEGSASRRPERDCPWLANRNCCRIGCWEWWISCEAPQPLAMVASPWPSRRDGAASRARS